MAEYIKFRVSAAKMGVTMAFLALLGGITDKARAASPTTAQASAAIPGVSSLVKLDKVFVKIENSLQKLEQKLASNYLSAQKIDTTFLKRKTANADYLKIDAASQKYLSINDASDKWLKIDAANAQFLKIDAANAQFLKIDGTAGNAQKLGGLAPSSFVQGNNTSVVSGALSRVPSSFQQLLSLPGGIIVVDISTTPGGGIALTFHNNTGTDLTAVGPDSGDTKTIPLPADQPTTVTLVPAVQDSQFQIFPGGSFQNVVSILIGLTPVPNTTQFEAVAQAFTGGV